MINIDKEKCIGCGLCIKDCPTGTIGMEDGKALFNNTVCIRCGHCIAVCPKNAVVSEEYDMNDVLEYNEDLFKISPERLLNFIKFRRTIRFFKDREVEDEKLLKIIEAGRFAPTGSNAQDVKYVIIKKDIQKFRKLILKSLHDIGELILKNREDYSEALIRYAKMWKMMYTLYLKNPNGRETLFFNSKAIILVVSKSPIDAGLASFSMELMANALGLGNVFSGFTVRGALGNKEIKSFLKIDEDEEVVSTMILGYPDISYKRTVPRKKPSINYL